MNGTNNQNKFSFNESKAQQISSFEYLNPNQRTCRQEPYQKSTSTQNQKPISASNPKPNPTNQNPQKSLLKFTKMSNASTKSKSNLSFKSKTKPNKSKPPKKIFSNSQKCQTPAQATHSITKTLALYEKSPSHLYVVNRLNQWVTHRVKVTLGASHSFDSRSHPLACNCNSLASAFSEWPVECEGWKCLDHGLVGTVAARVLCDCNYGGWINMGNSRGNSHTPPPIQTKKPTKYSN